MIRYNINDIVITIFGISISLVVFSAIIKVQGGPVKITDLYSLQNDASWFYFLTPSVGIWFYILLFFKLRNRCTDNLETLYFYYQPIVMSLMICAFIMTLHIITEIVTMVLQYIINKDVITLDIEQLVSVDFSSTNIYLGYIIISCFIMGKISRVKIVKYNYLDRIILLFLTYWLIIIPIHTFTEMALP
jgi:hypothetical protein